MEDSDRIICCGCLSRNRKMVLVEEFWKKQCFLQIINEVSWTQKCNNGDIWLCWECNALVNRFTRFKKQIQMCCKMLQEYSEEDPNLPHLSQLATYGVFLVPIPPDSTTNTIEKEVFCEVVKLEVETPVKEEPLVQDIDNISVHSDRSDDKLLIEMCTKNRKVKLMNGMRKKRKKRPGKDSEIKEIEIYKEIELKREDIENERRQLASQDEYTNAMFRCEMCITTFTNADDLSDHHSGKHNLNGYKCNICECTFTSEVTYNYHTNKHKKRYQCVNCMKMYGNKRAVIKHYETVHCVGTDLGYGLNDKSLENSDTQETENLKDNSTKPSFPCDYCAKTFRWKTSLRKHIETHRIETGQKRKPYCEPCRLSFTTTSNLQKHVKTSSKHQIQLKLRKLKESLPEPATPEKQQAHIAQITTSVNKSRQTFSCSQCDKRFQWRGNLLRHLHSHAARANGELVCAPCNRTFSSIATYKQHMKISKKHVSEDDFKYMCSDCGKRFADKTRLKDHVDWEHLKNFVHRCSLCQKVFKSHTSLYLHRQVVHKKDNAEHLCDHCGKPFPNRAKLRSHIIALHTSQSPYACASCGARFSWASCLSRHVRRVHRALGKGGKAQA